jgi:2-polyprenyl-3-methyl-5-hydroxy-6-metoxy-1,4-benzoquinol methylase
MNEQIQALGRYFELMNTNGASHVYRQALAAGLLDALTDGSLTAAALAKRCGLKERPTRLVLEALAVMGIVDASEDRFEISALAKTLIGGGYRALGDEYWAHLPTLLATDEPLQRMDAVAESESHYQSQAAALAWMLAPAAEAAAQKLSFGATTRDQEILDLGAGSAIWSLTMARHDEESGVTAVDWPAVLPVAVSTAERFGLGDRLSTLAGNFHEVELPAASFDIAILGNVTHLESPEGNLDLMKKARAALRPAGKIVIFDIFPGQAEGDLNRTLYALGLALRTENGTVYSPEELGALLGEAGYGPATLFDLPVPPFAVGMLVAESAG